MRSWVIDFISFCAPVALVEIDIINLTAYWLLFAINCMISLFMYFVYLLDASPLRFLYNFPLSGNIVELTHWFFWSFVSRKHVIGLSYYIMLSGHRNARANLSAKKWTEKLVSSASNDGDYTGNSDSLFQLLWIPIPFYQTLAYLLIVFELNADFVKNNEKA